MSHVDEKEFNNVFISYAHEDKEFVQRFREELQNRLGSSMFLEFHSVGSSSSFTRCD
jgi:hypothetical protein